MGWPSAQEYVDAALSGGDAFEDPELREAKPARDAEGQPITVVGRNAVVVALDGPEGRIALRCFLRERRDRDKRYERLLEYLARHRIEALAPFEYLPRGIRVGGAWRPVLKMPWIEGERLDARVRRLGDDRRALRELADDFFRMMGELARHNVAHGDLEPTNILVTPRGLRLVDVDTMYAPTLESMGAAEPGDEHHQHPRRARHDFGPGLDHFSAWVLHVSLLAISIEPSLHARHGAPGRLLFQRADFDAGAEAPAFRDLRAIEHGELLAERMLDALRWDPLTVPPLEDLQLPPPRVDETVVPDGAAAAAPVVEQADALDDAQAAEPASRAFDPALRLERASVWALLGGLALLAFFGFARATPWPVVAALAVAQFAAWAGYLVVAHALQPAVRARKAALLRLRNAEEAARAIEAQLAALPTEPAAATRAAAAQNVLDELRHEEEAEVRALEREVAHALEQIQRRRDELDAMGNASADARLQLDAQEAQVIDAARSREEEIRARWRADRARISADADATQHESSRARQALEAQRAGVARQLEGARRALAWARDEVATYDGARFVPFVRRVLLPRSRADGSGPDALARNVR